MIRKTGITLSSIIVFALLFSSCMSSKPIAAGTSKQESYVVFINPTYSELKLTRFTFFMMPVIIGSTGYLGYSLGTNLEEQIELGVVGGAVGFPIWGYGAAILSAIFDKQKEAPILESDALVWLKDYNRKNKERLILVSFDEGVLKTLPPGAKNNFIASSLEDFANYLRIFPNSPQTSMVFTSVLPHLNRNEVIELMRLWPNTCCMEAAQDELLNKSTSVNECVQIGRDYPRLYEKADEKAGSLVSIFSDIIDYQRFFKTSNYTERMIERIIPTLTRNEMLRLIELYPNVNSISEAKIRYVKTGKSFDETIMAMNTFSNYKEYGDSTLANYTRTIEEKRKFIELFPAHFKSNSFLKDIKDYENLMLHKLNNYLIVNQLRDMFYDKVKPLFILSKLKQISNEYPTDLSSTQLEILKHIRFVTSTQRIQNSQDGGIASFMNGGISGALNYKTNVGTVYKNELIWVLYPDKSVGGFDDYISPIDDPEELVGKILLEDKNISYSIYGRRISHSDVGDYDRPVSVPPSARSQGESLSDGWYFLGGLLGAYVGTVGTLKYLGAHGLIGTVSSDYNVGSQGNDDSKSETIKPLTKTTSQNGSDLSNKSLSTEVKVIQDGTWKYGPYESIRYKVICPNGYEKHIYYNDQKKCWMQTSSAFCDYSSDKGSAGLKKSAEILCNNHK